MDSNLNCYKILLYTNTFKAQNNYSSIWYRFYQHDTVITGKYSNFIIITVMELRVVFCIWV